MLGRDTQCFISVCNDFFFLINIGCNYSVGKKMTNYLSNIKEKEDLSHSLMSLNSLCP